MESIVGLIPNDEYVDTALRELRSAGFAENEVTLLNNPVDVWRQLIGRKKTHILHRDILYGAIVGLVLGGVFGILAGVLNCRLMGCALGTSLVFMSLLVLFSTIFGGLFGAIVLFDETERSFDGYLQGVQHGQTLFVIETSRQKTPQAREILYKAHAHEVQVMDE